jgi:hypothetical protein
MPLGVDRFEQDADAFERLAEALERMATAGGAIADHRATAVKSARDGVGQLAGSVVGPLVEHFARRFDEYCFRVDVGEVRDAYLAIRSLAAQSRATAEVIRRTEVYERNMVDQFAHDRGRDWDKAWHHLFENERSDEVNREYDRHAAEAQHLSAERHATLAAWNQAMRVVAEAVDRAMAALAARPADPPDGGLRPPMVASRGGVKGHIQQTWVNRSVLPHLKRIGADSVEVEEWWTGLSARERSVISAHRPDLARHLPDVPPSPGEPQVCSPGELASDRYVGRIDAATDFLGLPRLPDCAQDIPEWFQRYRVQLTQVRLPFEDAVAVLQGLSTGLGELASGLGIPVDDLRACNDGDTGACLRVGVAIGMAVPTRGGSARPRPRANLPAWKKLTLDMDHVAARHMPGGREVGPTKSLFENMTEVQIRNAVEAAYRSGRRLETQVGWQGQVRVRMRGHGSGYEIEMWVNLTSKHVETAYPVAP